MAGEIPGKLLGAASHDVLELVDTGKRAAIGEDIGGIDREIAPLSGAIGDSIVLAPLPSWIKFFQSKSDDP